MGLTFDTGALIAIAARDQRMWKVWRAARLDGMRITVPAPALAEWWRGPGPMTAKIRESVVVEPMTEELAAAAGEALAKVKGPSVTDATVMALAAQLGDVVYTSDPEDLGALLGVFPGVRIVRV
jgi:hypothetical protein